MNVRVERDSDAIVNQAVVAPFLLNPKYSLRPYQQKGLEWLVSLYEQGLSGILADEMGLGKTLQTISLLAYLAANKGIWGPHLIIVPTSTMLNWECEFKRFCPAIKVLTYYGSAKERAVMKVIPVVMSRKNEKVGISQIPSRYVLHHISWQQRINLFFVGRNGCTWYLMKLTTSKTSNRNDGRHYSTSIQKEGYY